MIIALFVLILVCGLILFFNSSVFTVTDNFVYIITRRGEYHRCVFAGTHFKIPFVDNIVMRYSLAESFAASEKSPIISSDNKTIQISTFVEYQIINPELFYKIAKSSAFIDAMTYKLILHTLANYTANDIINGNADVSAQIMSMLQKTSMDYGIVINNVTYQIHS